MASSDAKIVTEAAQLARKRLMDPPTGPAVAFLSQEEADKMTDSLEDAPIFVQRKAANFTFMFKGRLVCAEFSIVERGATEE